MIPAVLLAVARPGLDRLHQRGRQAGRLEPLQPRPSGRLAGGIGRQHRLRLTLAGPSGGAAHAEADLPASLEALPAGLPALARALLK